jgi:hypothetical protein
LGQALAGDIRASQSTVRIIEQRCRLLGLTAKDLVADQPRTMVLGLDARKGNQDGNG